MGVLNFFSRVLGVAVTMATSLKALPKAELHLHLEGAMRFDTLCDLSAKHGLGMVTDTRGVQFQDFSGFVDTYMRACECLRDEEDVMRLVREVAEDARASGAMWIEVALSLLLYHERFGGIRACLRLILRAAAEAETKTGVAIGLIVAVERMTEFFPMATAEELASAVVDLVHSGDALVHGRPGIVGLGLHGAEEGNPPEPFSDVFAAACACTYPGTTFQLAALPHAGELPPSPNGGAASVRFCVERLGARRIAHGVLAAGDSSLVNTLARQCICLDICPTSNFLLGVVPCLAEHPLKQFLKARVPCTINSDDPLLFGSSLLQEYEVCRTEMKLSDTDLAACATASFEHSHAPAAVKRHGLAGIKAWCVAAAAAATAETSHSDEENDRTT